MTEFLANSDAEFCHFSVTAEVFPRRPRMFRANLAQVFAGASQMSGYPREVHFSVTAEDSAVDFDSTVAGQLLEVTET